MSDDFPGDDPVESESNTTTVPDEGTGKLRQEVEINSVGACRKHIKVSVDRGDIEARMSDHYKKLGAEANITGFRPGKAPRRLVEKRFAREVSEQVKSEILVASLEQLSQEYQLTPLSQPDINVEKMELPATGPFVYDFHIEVRPQFDLPDYRGLKIRRPVKDFNKDDLAAYRRQALRPFTRVVPKDGGSVQLGDVIIASVRVTQGDKVLAEATDTPFDVERKLYFHDGAIDQFAEGLQGARAGDSRTLSVRMLDVAGPLAGQTLKATFQIKEVKARQTPELTEEFLEPRFDVMSAEMLDERLMVELERNQQYQQRRAARRQVLATITDAASWELPTDLLDRQTKLALQRRLMEMKSEGMSEQQIDRQKRRLEQNAQAMTAMSLREHFVFQKIAEVEGFEVKEDEIEDEIERMANEANESPRRLRARLEKEEAMDALTAEMVERKVLDLIIDAGEYVDVPFDQEAEDTMGAAEADLRISPLEPVAEPAEAKS